MGVEIKIDGLTKSFGKQLIWGDVTLTVPAGEICVMLGPSGTGKSVLLKTLIGLSSRTGARSSSRAPTSPAAPSASSTRSASSSASCSRTAPCSAR